MRTRPLALLATLLLASPAAAATRNFGISSFDRIRVDGPFKVNLTTGVAPFATASGSTTAIDHVAVDVEGRTLYLGAFTAWASIECSPSAPTTIRAFSTTGAPPAARPRSPVTRPSPNTISLT